MWDTVEISRSHLSHDLPCPRCGHAAHTYLPCSDTCGCRPVLVPGVVTGRSTSGVRGSRDGRCATSSTNGAPGVS